MNSILTSFLCGAAFIGGAAATTVFVVLAQQWRNGGINKALMAYWEKSIICHERQIDVLSELVEATKRNHKP